MARETKNEAWVKAKVLNRMRMLGWINCESVISSEFPVRAARTRVDLAIVARHIIAIEVKSELDSLKRLPAQLIAYRSYFDRVVLVCHSKHYAELSQMDLRGASLWLLWPNDEITTHFEIESNSDATKSSLSELLTKKEQARYLNNQGNPPRAPASPEESEAAFRSAFSARYGDQSRLFWRRVRGREVRERDISALSRFKPIRKIHKAHAKEIEHRWASWSALASDKDAEK